MGLDELVGDNTPIKSRRKVSNHKMSKHNWKWMVLHHPEELTYICKRNDAEEAKMWINVIDDILENGVVGVTVSETEKENLQHAREELMEYI